MNIYEIAYVCHQANKAYCEVNDDYSQKDWNSAEQWQVDSVINGVKFALENPLLNPIDSHENWLKDKLNDGWKYGPVKDPNKKEHPCMVAYHELPAFQRVKDQIFISIVRAMNKLNT